MTDQGEWSNIGSDGLPYAYQRTRKPFDQLPRPVRYGILVTYWINPEQWGVIGSWDTREEALAHVDEVAEQVECVHRVVTIFSGLHDL